MKAQLSEELCQSVLFLLKCQYMQYLWGKLWKCRAQFIKHNCTRQKCHPFMQVIPDLGNIFSMKKTSYPSFQFQGAWLLDCTLLSSQVFLGACVLFWMVCHWVCPALPLTAFQPGAILQTTLGWVSCTPPSGAFLLCQSRAAFCPGCWHRSLEDAGHWAKSVIGTETTVSWCT